MTGKKDNLIVFDWNGTLLADTTACLNAANAVLETLGAPKVTRARYQRHYTMPLYRLYHALGVDPGVLMAREHEIHPLFHKTYDSATIRLRRGAKATLQTLRLASYKSIILSNYIIRSIEEQAKRLGIRENFHEIIAFDTGSATFRERAKGARLKNYLQANPPRACIIIGDSEEEIEIGRDLGLVTIAITDGMCSTSRLRAMKPDFLVRTLEQVPAIADRVFGGKKAA